MSTFAQLLGQDPDPRAIELVKSLAEKTRQGKIAWSKQTNALTARIPQGLQINFVLPAAIPFLKKVPNWQLLTVRDQNGNELLKVSSPYGAALLMPSTTNPLIDAVQELFTVAHGPFEDDLDRAIKTVKNL